MTTRGTGFRFSCDLSFPRALSLWVAAFVSLAGIAHGQDTPTPTIAVEAATPAPAPVEPYRIGAGDRLLLFVWKEAEITRELVVRVDGMVTVPLIGDTQAASLTTSELSAEVRKRLALFLNNPSVTVGLLGAQSAQFYVVGRVSRPGAYPIDKPTTFLQALALAGGFAEFAKTDRVLVFRGAKPPIPVNYKKLEGGEDTAENISVQAGDTILVP